MKCPFKKITINYDCNGSQVGVMNSNRPVAEIREFFDECDKNNCPAYQPAERISCSLCVRNK